jgi:HD-GYP domain-containing protein (c-di-GMP phosphodiesterase class II)
MNKLGGNQIRVGLPVPFDCYDGHGNLLLRKGLVVDSQKQVDFLLERGLYTLGGTATGPGGDVIAKPPTPFQLLDDFTNRLKQLLATLSGITEGSTEQQASHNFPERVMNLASEVQLLCQKDADALLGAIHLAKGSRYSLDHPLYRSVVTDLLGSRKGLSLEERQRMVAASLTCDISMVKLQDELVRQAGPLSPVQKQSIEAHPLESARLLEALGVTDKEWITAVAQHHEVLNGTGYPRRCSGADVSLWARIIRLADMYTAMISPKAYRKTALSKSAMREILLKRGTEIDDSLSVLIVKELGIYPPGAFVKLQSGELGIVIKRHVNPKTPIIKAVVGPRGAPFDTPIPRKTDAREYEILDVVERDAIVKLDFHKLWGYDG